jgi:hypothetical protein
VRGRDDRHTVGGAGQVLVHAGARVHGWEKPARQLFHVRIPLVPPLSAQVSRRVRSWIVLALWLGGTVFWLYRVNRALSVFDGLFIIPILQAKSLAQPRAARVTSPRQAFFVIWTIIVGGVYFKEFDHFSVRPSSCSPAPSRPPHSFCSAQFGQALGFSSGVLVVIFGVFLLAPRCAVAVARHCVSPPLTCAVAVPKRRTPVFLSSSPRS